MKNILIVDDIEVNRKYLGSVLSKMGHSVDEAENGHIAIQKAVKKVYDVIFMDIEMPIMDGLSATKYLKEKFDKTRNKVTKIIGLSSSDLQGISQKGFDSGMDNFFSKPYDINEILKYI